MTFGWVSLGQGFCVRSCVRHKLQAPIMPRHEPDLVALTKTKGFALCWYFSMKCSLWWSLPPAIASSSLVSVLQAKPRSCPSWAVLLIIFLKHLKWSFQVRMSSFQQWVCEFPPQEGDSENHFSVPRIQTVTFLVVSHPFSCWLIPNLIFN